MIFEAFREDLQVGVLLVLLLRLAGTASLAVHSASFATASCIPRSTPSQRRLASLQP